MESCFTATSDMVETNVREIKNWECKPCHKVYKTSSGLSFHMEAVHENKVRNCSICNKTFKTGKSLKAHMTMHNETNRTYSCDQCDKVYKRKPALNMP